MSALQHFRRLGRIDPSAAVRELEQRPQLWELFTLRQQYEGSAHKDTQCIPLRGPTTLEDIFDNLEAVDFAMLNELPATLDVLVRVLQMSQAREVGRVMLVKLLPQGHVTPHVDEGRYAEHFARFHLVFTSSPDCHFCAGGERVVMAPGELWWFNHRVEHEVRNGGTDRIHLIVDLTAPGYTGALGVPA